MITMMTNMIPVKNRQVIIHEPPLAQTTLLLCPTKKPEYQCLSHYFVSTKLLFCCLGRRVPKERKKRKNCALFTI